MIVLWITLSILGAILLLFLLLLLLGRAKVRITCRERLRVVATICGFPLTLVSDKEETEEEPPDLSRCRDPEKALQKELKRQRKLAEKAKKKRLKAKKKAEKRAARKAAQHAKRPVASPNLKENLEMILALLRRLYHETKGKIHVKFRRMHIYVGTDNAAKTAILYGVILQSTAYLLEFADSHFIVSEHQPGDMTVEADYSADTCRADIDIVCSIRLIKGLGIALALWNAYRREKSIATKKAILRRARALRRATKH